MNLMKEIFDIIKEDKWDYSKLAQITGALGGPAKAIAKTIVTSATLGVATWEGSRFIGKKLKAKIKKKIKKLSKNENDEINLKTEIYLERRKEMISTGEDVTLLDQEYNEFMATILGESKDTERE